jgi:hypothetical protein
MKSKAKTGKRFDPCSSFQEEKYFVIGSFELPLTFGF